MTKTIETDDYQYDIFLSYSRKNGVKDWVWNHFEPFDQRQSFLPSGDN